MGLRIEAQRSCVLALHIDRDRLCRHGSRLLNDGFTATGRLGHPGLQRPDPSSTSHSRIVLDSTLPSFPRTVEDFDVDLAWRLAFSFTGTSDSSGSTLIFITTCISRFGWPGALGRRRKRDIRHRRKRRDIAEIGWRDVRIRREGRIRNGSAPGTAGNYSLTPAASLRLARASATPIVAAPIREAR